MATLNKVMLIGRMIDNPEPPKPLNNGGTVIKFRFAVGRSKKDPATGQWVNDPNPLYIDCEAFANPDSKRNLVSVIEKFAKKGDSLYLEGRLVLDQWEDKNGGGKRSKHKLVVDSVELLGTKSTDGGEGGGGSNSGGGGGNYGGNAGGGRAGGSSGGGYGGKPATPPKNNAPPDDSDEYGSGSSGGDGDPIPF